MPASSSQEGNAQTVLTILDSSDEEDHPAPVPKYALKGKGKRPAPSTEESENDDEPPPSVKKSSQFEGETGTDTAGDLEESADDDDEMAGGTTKAMLLKNDFKSSTKLDALVESLNSAREKDPSLKAVVFSQVGLSLLVPVHPQLTYSPAVHWLLGSYRARHESRAFRVCAACPLQRRTSLIFLPASQVPAT